MTGMSLFRKAKAKIGVLLAVATIQGQQLPLGIYNLKKVPGVVVAGPKRIARSTSGATITLRVSRAGGPSLLDILVSDSQAAVSVTLPSGQVITRSSPQGQGFGWLTLENGQDLAGEDFDPGPLLLLGEGTHELIGFRSPDTGTYRIRVGALKTSDVTVRAAFIPVKAMEETVYSDILDPTSPAKRSK